MRAPERKMNDNKGPRLSLARAPLRAREPRPAARLQSKYADRRRIAVAAKKLIKGNITRANISLAQSRGSRRPLARAQQFHACLAKYAPL